MRTNNKFFEIVTVLVLVTSIVCFDLPRVILLSDAANATSIGGGPGERDDMDHQAEWQLTRYKVTGFSLFDHGFENGQHLHLGIDTMKDGERIKVNCNQDIDFILGSNQELSIRLKVVGPIESLCGCLDSLELFAHSGDGEGEGEEGELNITVNVTDQTTSNGMAQEFFKEVVLLSALNMPVLRSISPTRGPFDVETNVTLSVEPMTAASCHHLICRFQGESFQMDIPIAALSKDCGKIVCPVPPAFHHSRRGGYVLVGLSDGEKASNLVHFFHENNEAVRTLQSETTVLKTVGMVVTEIFPVSGPTTGGSSILFIGVSYVDNPNIRCKFGNRNAHARWISSSEVECISPRHPSSGFVNVSLDMGEDFATSAGVKFLYYNDPIILKFSPQVGPVVGGIQVTVFVDSVHESDDLVCRFGLVAVPARYLNASAAQCNLPPNRAGESVSISISRNSGHDYSPFSKDSLRYLSSPTIDDVSPLFVRKGRRTKLKIRGTGFQPYGILATSARCVFGENVTMVVPTYFRSEEIHCSTPLSSVTGSIPFHVTIGEDGSIKSDTSICYYVEDYRIRSIAPDYSHTAGGSQIMLWGENLIEADTIVCKLGESLVNATFAGLNEILCIAPPNPPGDEPLFISFDGENFDETGHFVRYSDNDNHPVDGIPNPISEVEEHTSVDNEGDVIVVTPIVEEVLASGFDSLPNGTLGVTIIGNNFVKSPDLSCNISLKRGIVIWISQYQIECHAVLPRSQKLDVSVSNDGISFVNTSFASSGQRSFSIYTTQHIAATRRIVVRGSLFTKISTWICVVNKHRVVAEIVDKNELICTLPPSVDTAQISLCVCQDDLYCTEDMELMIVNQISIYNAAPLSGSLNGGTRVQFRMMHDIGPDAKCRFGRYDVEIVKADDRDTFYCVAPLVHSPKKVELLVSLDGKHFSASQLMFSFLPPITLLKLYPLRIQARQTASTLRVYGSGFVNLHSMICNFDDDVWSRALWVSDTEIWCSVPKLEPGLAQVSLSYDDSTKSENTLALTIVDHSVQVTSIFPLCGPVGTKLKVCGTNLNLITDGYCHFGEEVVPSQFDEPSCVRCLTPFREPGQKTNIALSSNGFISSQAGTVFTVIPVILQSFMPAQVEMDRRGVKFTVVGAGFECLTPDTFCRIGNVTSDSVAISSSTLLSCTFDRLGVSGIHQLTLLNSYFEVLSETSPLKIIVSPEIYSINPRWLVEGTKNNVLEIRGKNLKGSNFTCFIGGQSSTEAIVTGDDRALCVVDRCHNGVNKVHVSNDGVQISQSSQAIQCFAPSVIDRIHPIFGLSGTVIDIIGVNLRNESQCFFGSDVVSAHFINSTYLQCQIPSRFGEWNTTLRIKVDDREISLIENEFIFTMVDLGIISVSPNHGSVRGGTQVTIELEKGLSSHISHCWFDRTCVPATPASSGNQVTCITPPQNSTGIARVGLSTNGQDSTDNDVIFEYMDDIRIHSVEPARVSEIGGAMMSIHGSDFPNTRNLGCIVGEIYISADWVSENVVQCMLPALVPGDYRIGMSSNGIDQVFTPEGSRPLRIFHSITLTRVLPAVGKITGNTKIVLHGTNFFSSSGLACKFGSVLTKAAFLSSNKINCWTPAWPATENANLVVSISGQISSNHVIFRFIDPFDFFEMKPRYLFLEGGTIAVSGNGPFEEHDEFECLIGEQVIVGKLRGDNTVVCESPRNNAGTVIPVSIRYGQGDIFPIRNGQLTYFKRGNFTSTQIMPTSSLGTNRVLFHGANLSDHYKNGVFCRGPKGNFIPGVITGSSDIFCDVTAFGSSEIVRIEVSRSKDGELVESLLVKMNNAFQFSSSSPNTGLVRRPHLVSIVGNGFLTIHLVECRFDSRVFVPAHIINSTLMQCLMPMQSTVGAARLDITVNRHQILSPFSKLHFTFVDPQVASIRPSHGSVRGGTQVTIELEKGLSSHISHCWFDRTCVPATPASSGNQVTCITPPQNSTGIARVGLSTNGQDSTDNDVIFEYMDDIRIHSVEPARVSEIGGAMMSIHGSDFPNTRNLGCIVGEIYISADWVSENVVQCMLPALVPGDYRIEVTNADRSCNSETHLKVYPEFLVNSYSITARANIFYVDLAFTRLVNSYIPGISCQIGDDIIPSFFLKDNLLSCEVPLRIVYQSNKSFQLHLLIDGEESPTSPGVFDMLLPPVILTVDPTRVHSRGAILVTIFGAFENYANITLHHGLCQFGTMTTSMNGVPNMTNVQCKVPGRHKGGQVGLSISFDGGQNWSNSVPFELLPPVQIKSVYPTKVPSNGGVTISVGLDHCEPRMKLRCIFGASIEYLAIWVSTSMIQCISPPQSPGLMSLALVNNMEHIVGENITIYVHGAPRIHTLYPRFGVFTGGTQVRIIGRELNSLQEPFCFFGKSRSRASIIGPGSLLCTTPVMGQTSNVSVSIIDVLTSFEWLADFRFEYTKLPHISSVTYDHSTNTVILMGKALNSAGKLWCRFDETNNNTAIAIMQANQSQALCPLPLIPSLATGKSLFVQASNNEIDWTPKILFHTQILDIYVKKVWPVEGSIIGGTVVVIDTEIPIFDKGPNCFFGKIAVSPIVVSQTRFQCISPRFNSLDDVSLTFGYGQEPSRHEEGIAFTLQPPCTIHHIAPRYLSIGDRDPVTIMGTNFIASRSYSCFFGAVQMPALRLDSSTLHCTSPMNGIGSIRINVVSNIGDECLNDPVDTTLMYIEPAIISEIVPNIIPVTSAVNITIFGQGFNDKVHNECILGNILVKAIFQSSTEVICLLPKIETSRRGLAVLRLHSSKSQAKIRTVLQPHITSVTPSRIGPHTNETLDIVGNNFLNTAQLKCAFGNQR